MREASEKLPGRADLVNFLCEQRDLVVQSGEVDRSFAASRSSRVLVGMLADLIAF